MLHESVGGDKVVTGLALAKDRLSPLIAFSLLRIDQIERDTSIE
jgi:hypothetical protein